MISTRMCTYKDKAAMKKLWTELFGDSKSFTDWFFDNRFYPQYCVCTYDNDLLVSCAHSLPMPVLIRGKEIPCAMISGIATVEAYRKQGLMHKTLLYLINELNAKGIYAATLKAVNLSTYYSIHYYGCTLSAYIRSCKKDKYACLMPYIERKANSDVSCRHIDIYDEFDGLHACYTGFIKGYSGIAIRDKAAFKLKMNDYLSDNAKAIAVFKDGKITGYCIYFDEKDLYAEEYITDDLYSACAMFKALKEQGKSITVKTSKKVADRVGVKNTEVTEQNSMGIINIGKLLESICGYGDYGVKVFDSFYNPNNGIYLLNGKKVNDKYHLELSSGHLMQLLTGHKSLEELVSEGVAVIHDKVACDEISKMFPEQNCFIADEY